MGREFCSIALGHGQNERGDEWCACTHCGRTCDCPGTSDEPAVDTEAAAVWERLSPSMRDVLDSVDDTPRCFVGPAARGGMFASLRGLVRRGLAERGARIDGLACWRRTDLGRRVASYGAAVASHGKAVQ